MHIHLRNLGPEDINDVWGWASDPEFSRYLTWPAYSRREDLQRHLEQAALKVGYPDQMFGIVADGALVGSIHCIARDAEHIQIGWGVRRDRWGEGIAPRATCCVMAMVAATWEGSLFRADIHQENVRAVRVAKRLGFCLIHTDVEPFRNRYVCPFTSWSDPAGAGGDKCR